MNAAPTTSTTKRPAAPDRASRLRQRSGVMIGLLLAQFLLGMADNLWLVLPDSGSGWEKAAPAVLLYSHIVVGLGAVVLGVWILVLAIRVGGRPWTVVAIVGLVGLVGAFAAGTFFMRDVSNDTLSFLMATGWAVAVAAYVIGLVRLRKLSPVT